ncbi:MAG: hypothetical protein C0404_10155 [Verrucomicrobia bacterium]|nr:hypothetical protein [Verrucomicrobiota bacterium]
MRKAVTQFLAAFATLVTAACAFAGEPDLEITVNRDKVYLGEPILLTVKVPTALGNSAPDVSAITNASITAYAPQPQNYFNYINVNGRIRQQSFSGIVYSFEMVPAESGRFVAGPITLTAGGRRIVKPGPVVQVEGIQKQDWVIISIKASKEAVLVDEPFEITASIGMKRLAGRFIDTPPILPDDPVSISVPFFPRSIANQNLTRQYLDGLEGPDIQKHLSSYLTGKKNPGFYLNDLRDQNDGFDPRRMFAMDPDEVFGFGDRRYRFMFEKQSASTNGIAYMVFAMKTRFTPTKEGNYTFGPIDFKGNVVTATDDAGRATTQPVWAIGPACTVRVVPPPLQDRPASYIGAVGSNLVVDAMLDAQTCSVGDPLTLTLWVTGNIRLENVYPPDLAAQPNLLKDFRLNEENVQASTKDNARIWKYTIRPTRAGTLELPPIDVAYYDIIERSYKIARTRALPVRAEEALIVTPDIITSTATNRPANETRQTDDMLSFMAPLNVDPAGAERHAPSLRPWQIAALAGGPLFFLAVLLVKSGTRAITAHRAEARRRNAAGKAARKLRAAGKEHASDPSILCHLVYDTLKEFLHERFDITAAGITPSDARSILEKHGIDPVLVDRFCGLFERNFNATYTGTGAARHDVAADAASACEILNEIDRTSARGIRRGLPSTGAVVMLLSVVSIAGASDIDERQFIWEEANSRMVSARTPEDYLKAAASYDKLLRMGARNGILFYNLGTALTRAGQYDEAIRMMERAERYAGSNEDIRQNMLLAISKKEKNRNVVLPWHRMFLFWHYGLSMNARISVGVIAFSIFWLALTVRLMGGRSFGKEIMIISLITVALMASSLATSFHQEQKDEFRGLRMKPVATTSPEMKAAATNENKNANQNTNR